MSTLKCLFDIDAKVVDFDFTPNYELVCEVLFYFSGSVPHVKFDNLSFGLESNGITESWPRGSTKYIATVLQPLASTQIPIEYDVETVINVHSVNGGDEISGVFSFTTPLPPLPNEIEEG